jgi:hypothetical protein
MAFSAGCTRHDHNEHEPKPASAPSPPSGDVLQKQLDEALVQLVAVRGLSAERAIAKKVLPKSEFRQRLASEAAKVLSIGDRDLSSLLYALNFADAATDVQSIATRVIDDSQTDAFYSSGDGVLYIKQPARPDYDARDDAAVIMALEHAIQDQRFGPLVPGPGPELDGRLAALALREGDAAAASLAYSAKRAGKPVIETVHKTAELLSALPVDSLITSVGFSPALGSAPLLIRDALARLRPAGLRLVAAMLRAKGFDLVDRALAHPPASMLAVYEPALYVRGWKPENFSQKGGGATGTLGLVAVTSFLERCLPTDQAKSFALDWRGDRYALQAHKEGSAVVVWSTAWKDGATAQRFADTVTSSGQCRAPGTSAAMHFEVARAGAVVAITNSPDRALITAAAAHGVTTPSPSAPPLGDVQLELPKSNEFRVLGHAPIDVHKAGVLTGRRYANEILGLDVEIPSGFQISTDAILAVDYPPPSLASGRVAFEQSSAPFDQPADFFASFGDRMSRVFFRGAPLTEVSSGDLRTPFGQAPYRDYDMQGRAHVRVLALPLCGRRAAIVVSEVFMDKQGSDQLGAWLQSFKPRAKPSVCAALASAPQ